MDSTFEQRVRERAFDLWLRAGGVRGHADHHWFQAVRDILAAPEEVPPRAPVAPQRHKRRRPYRPLTTRRPTLAPRATIAAGAG